MEKIKELEKRIENLEEIVKTLKKDHVMESENKNTSKLEKLLIQHISNT